jgi:hypothetical protein
LNGWKRVATLFELPESTLHKLFVSYNNNIGDEGALVFAEALAGNSSLKLLSLYGSGITYEGWAHFSKLLCDTSSVNNTYMSNHTIESFGSFSYTTVTGDVRTLLVLNRNENKQLVAITKILQNHSHFDMQPFFEWEFKVLPIMISWFAKASTCTSEFETKINRMSLSATYDFIREFPTLYIEPVTRKEIAECNAMEEELQGDELEEIRQRKARALRRL